MNETRRMILSALSSAPVSGPTLAERADISRAAVWKQIEALRSDGFAIESTSDGYVITEVPEYGSSGAIEYGLSAPYTVEYHDTLASTNKRGRELAGEGESDVVVVAGEQTGGRGRLGREFHSPVGGVWMTIVLRPDRPPAHAPLYTLAAAVAVVDAARALGVDAAIKWPNDVLVPETAGKTERGGHKLCGILTEMEGEADRVSWLIVGIGINAAIDATSLPAAATSLQSEISKPINRGDVARTVLTSFHEHTTDLDTVLDAWCERSATIGMEVRVETSTGVIEGTAVDVVSPGALVVETDTGRETVHSGDCEHLRPASR
ncbi:biotin--[acetyl-CoA-carboxylase] ligase [Halorubraceae archaeon YAN]|nr:biotin--[acetyl-CoA-carboxylase] ligase [Halorubraceae archaeon YAN]